jgi:Tfp pilus assembly protein PilZ
MSPSNRKQKSLTAMARSLDTRKLPVPTVREGRGPSASQRSLIEKALRAKPAPQAPSSTKAKAALQALPPAPKPVVVDRPKPPKVVAPAARPQVAVVPRQAALNSLQREPHPLPSRVPTPAKVTPKPDTRRQYPRAEIQVRAKLSIADDPRRFFEATLPTVNLSVGGMFLESSFFLRLGTKLLITLELPNHERAVRVHGEVVRVESAATGPSGFALRFTEYLDGSQVTLATHFLSPVLREFLSQYAKEHRFDASPAYLAHTSDVLAAWELKKAELGGNVWDLFAAHA